MANTFYHGTNPMQYSNPKPCPKAEYLSYMDTSPLAQYAPLPPLNYNRKREPNQLLTPIPPNYKTKGGLNYFVTTN